MRDIVRGRTVQLGQQRKRQLSVPDMEQCQRCKIERAKAKFRTKCAVCHHSCGSKGINVSVCVRVSLLSVSVCMCVCMHVCASECALCASASAGCMRVHGGALKAPQRQVATISCWEESCEAREAKEGEELSRITFGTI